MLQVSVEALRHYVDLRDGLGVIMAAMSAALPQLARQEQLDCFHWVTRLGLASWQQVDRLYKVQAYGNPSMVDALAICNGTPTPFELCTDPVHCPLIYDTDLLAWRLITIPEGSHWIYGLPNAPVVRFTIKTAGGFGAQLASHMAYRPEFLGAGLGSHQFVTHLPLRMLYAAHKVGLLHRRPDQ